MAITMAMAMTMAITMTITMTIAMAMAMRTSKYELASSRGYLKSNSQKFFNLMLLSIIIPPLE